MTEKPTEVEEAVDELFEDPDSPDKGDSAPPPQTIANETAKDRDDRTHEMSVQK